MAEYLDINGCKELLNGIKENYIANAVVIDDESETSTNGFLGTEQVNTLIANDNNFVMLHNEKFYLMDKRYDTGANLEYLIYSHTCIENEIIWLKTITIDVSKESWVLNTREVYETKVMTQSEFDALTTKSSNTIYYIEEEES